MSVPKTKNARRTWAFAGVLAAGCLLIGASVGIGMLAGGVPISVNNDTVVLGELDRYDPVTEQAAEQGASLGFDEESNLQQEKTAGFTGNAVTSQVEPLPAGITGYAEAEPTGNKATTGEPPALVLSGDLTMPANHAANGIAPTACFDCHQMAE